MRLTRFAYALCAGLLLAAPGRAAAADTTLSFPTWQAEEPGFSQWWKELIAAYEQAHPDVKIALQQVAYPNFTNEMTIRFASNTPPDIVRNSAGIISAASPHRDGCGPARCAAEVRTHYHARNGRRLQSVSISVEMGRRWASSLMWLRLHAAVLQ